MDIVKTIFCLVVLAAIGAICWGLGEMFYISLLHTVRPGVWDNREYYRPLRRALLGAGAFMGAALVWRVLQ